MMFLGFLVKVYLPPKHQGTKYHQFALLTRPEICLPIMSSELV
jgi:hypothetical protein